MAERISREARAGGAAKPKPRPGAPERGAPGRRKKAPPTLREESPYGLAIEGANDGLWDWEAVSDRVFRSHRIQEILGQQAVDTVSRARDWTDLIHPEDQERYASAVRRLFKGKHQYLTLEYRVRHVDGSYRWVLDRAIARRDGAGRVVRMAGSLSDVTDSKRAEEALRESEQRFRLLIAGIKDYAIMMLDSDGRVVSWNEGAARIKGYRADEIIGRDFSCFFLPEDVARFLPALQLEEARTEGRSEDTGWRLRKDGSRFWANAVLTALYDEEGNPRGYSMITRDVTERERAAEALRLSEQRFRLLIAGVKDYAIFMLDAQGRIVSWNVSAERIKGYRANEILGKHFSCFYPQEDLERGKPKLVLEIASREGRVEDTGWRIRKDGSRFMANVVISALYDEAGTLVGFAKVTRDVTERERTQAGLRSYADRLRLLSARLIDLQEIERRRIALELHDEIGQALTALKINLEAMQRGSAAFANRPRVDESIEIVGQLIHDVRDMSLTLRPSILDDFGLMPALRWYTTRQAERSGFVIDLVEEGTPLRSPPPIETACFRIAQEALTNIARHAQAKHVKMIVRHGDNKVELMIDDDGVGFDPAEARENVQHGRSHGLLGMQERTRLLDGQISIESSPGNGARIRAEFPLTAIPAGVSQPGSDRTI